MVQTFIDRYVKMIVQHPEQVSVDLQSVSEGFSEITIFAAQDDVGKIIGKDGHMISAIKTVVSGCKAKDGVSYKIMVKTADS